jgi:hypothetical protein
MPIDTTVEGIEFTLAPPPARNTFLMDWVRQGWFLARLAITGLLLWYLANCVHDFQRILRLEAEPTPPFKVITKHEAWQRIYNPSAIRSAIARSSGLESIVGLQ